MRRSLAAFAVPQKALDKSGMAFVFILSYLIEVY
jgi:hypothetical protein